MSARPPKKWFYSMIERVKKYASDPEGLVGWIWYQWLGPKERARIKKREYGMGKSARYDPDTLTKKQEHLVNLYREIWGSTAGLSSKEIQSMSEPEINGAIKSLKKLQEWRKRTQMRPLEVREFDPGMSKKHFEKLAEIVKDVPMEKAEKQNLVGKLMAWLKEENPRFDSNRFYEAVFEAKEKVRSLDPQRGIESHIESLNEEIDQIAQHLADLWITGGTEESGDKLHKRYWDKADQVKGELGEGIWKNVDFKVGQILSRWEKDRAKKK